MVKGLEIFKSHFSDFQKNYLIIGGTACDLILVEAGLNFRATKDLDIVLCLEAKDSGFIESFWKFIKKGQYQNKESSTGKNQFYRFTKPKTDDFPYMLELFSRMPDSLEYDGAGAGTLTPIPTEDDSSSLSAILLNKNYYEFIKTGIQIVADVPILKATHLIPLKAIAWIELSDRKKNGENIDSTKIKKHKNDIFRLYQVIEPETKVNLPVEVSKNMKEYFERMSSEPLEPLSLGIKGITKDEILTMLKTIYSE